MKKLKMVELYGYSKAGSQGAFELNIQVGATKLPDIRSEAIQIAAIEAADIIENAIMAEVYRNDPDMAKEVAEERSKLLGLFSGRIFVKEIPNGYGSHAYYANRPWFVVTTDIGHFKIGWRKSVIQIDWSETVASARATDLFKDEQTSKDDRWIHAWSYEDARRYIDAIFQSASATP